MFNKQVNAGAGKQMNVGTGNSQGASLDTLKDAICGHARKFSKSKQSVDMQETKGPKRQAALPGCALLQNDAGDH